VSRSRAPQPEPADRAIEVGPVGLGVAVAVLLLAVVAAWLYLARPGGAPGAGPPGNPVSGTAAAVAAGHRGQPTWQSPEGDPGLGPPAAPVTVVAYSDYQCPNCRQFATEVLPWLTTTWMPAGLVRVVFRDFPVRGPESARAAEAAHCAAEQGRFWDYHDRLFASQSGENQGAFSDDNLRRLAAEAGLEPGGFDGCLAEGRYRNKVTRAGEHARKQGFEGTPAFVVNGNTTSGAIPVARWNELFSLYAQQFGVAPPSGAQPPAATP
jgi:protein-disulfide isomerase